MPTIIFAQDICTWCNSKSRSKLKPSLVNKRLLALNKDIWDIVVKVPLYSIFKSS